MTRILLHRETNYCVSVCLICLFADIQVTGERTLETYTCTSTHTTNKHTQALNAERGGEKHTHKPTHTLETHGNFLFERTNHESLSWVPKNEIERTKSLK